MKKGYTLVELLIVIVIVGILTTIAFVGFGKIQADARDQQRLSNATIIAEALEKYYDKHGEYPSINNLTNNNASQVKTTLGIVDSGVLVMPKSTDGTTNSIVSDADPAIDKLVYDAESINEAEDNDCKSAEVGNPAGCDKFTLFWKTESDDQEEIRSRHSERDAVISDNKPDAPPAPVMSAGLSGSNALGTITTVSVCTTGTPEYKIRTWINSETAPDWSTIANWSASLSRSVLTVPSTYYRFQAIARCNLNSTVSEDSDESNVASYFSAPGAADTPSLTSTDNGATFTATATVSAACAGTRYYSIQLRTNSGAWSADSWQVSNTRSQAMSGNPSVSYEFQAKSRCTLTGAISGVSNIETAVSAPSAPVITSPAATTSGSSNSVTWYWNAVTCPTGFTAQYTSSYTYNKGASYVGASSWSTTRTRTVDTSDQGYGYGVLVRARCLNSQAASLPSSNSALRLYNKDISVDIWVYTGTIHTFRPNSDSSPTYVIGRAKVKTSKRSETGSTSASCDTGSASTNGLKRQINFTWDSDEGGSARKGWQGWEEWPSGAKVFRADFGGGNSGDLDDNSTFEAIFLTRCARYSGATVLNTGDYKESDNFGNLRMVNSTGRAHTLCDQNVPAPYCEGDGTGYNEAGTSTGTCKFTSGSHKYCFGKLFNANTEVWGW